MKKSLIITIFVSLLLFLSYLIWAHSQRYKGDGVFTDNGVLSAHERYVLDLGKIQLNRNGEYTYFMSNLPAVEMTVGFTITVNPTTAENLKRKQLLSTIRIRLINGEGNNVIDEEGPLSDWVWSETPYHCYIYRQGQEKEIKTDQRLSYFERTGVKADAGWGTYFTPKRHASYKLSVTVFPARNAGAAPMASVQVIGGGWK